MYGESGINQETLKEVFDMIFAEIKNALMTGKRVEFRTFGTFEIREKKERMTRNPKTGAPVLSPAHRVVVFHPSSQVKQAVRNFPDTPNTPKNGN
jgi:nucleoid DNA-binding protein